MVEEKHRLAEDSFGSRRQAKARMWATYGNMVHCKWNSRRQGESLKKVADGGSAKQASLWSAV